MILFLLIISFLPLVPAYDLEPDMKHRPRHFAGENGGSVVDSYDHTVSIREIPYHVLVVYGNMYCSGTLVASKVIITAASCFHRHGTEDVFVKVGSGSLVGPGQLIKVIKVKIHEFYKNLSDTDNDIAMLVLETHVIFGPTVKKVVLIEAGKSMYVGADLDISGFGSTNLPAKYVNKLVRTEMNVIHRSQCREHYGGLITNSNYCAGYSLERRLSDNGGPAVNKGVMVGLVSFGANHKEPPFVTVITNVSYFYKWIKVNTQRFLSIYCADQDSEFSSDYYDDLKSKLWDDEYQP